MSETPETGIEESDPNADSPEGLAGGMGVSSERKGPVRGPPRRSPTRPRRRTPRSREGETPPEQSAYDGQPEVHPDNDVPAHPPQPRRQPGSRELSAHRVAAASRRQDRTDIGMRSGLCLAWRGPRSPNCLPSTHFGGIRMPPSTRTVSAFM